VTGDPQAPGGLGEKAVYGVRWTAISRGAIEVVLLGSMVVLARLIPPAEFGRYAVALIAQELAIFIAAEGVGTALVQRRSVTREHLQAGVALAALAAVALASLTLVLATILVTPLFGGRTAALTRLCTPAFLLMGAGTVPTAILRRRLAFKRLGIIDMTTSVVRAVVCVGLALVGLNAEALVLGGLAGGVVGTGIAWASAPPPRPRLQRTATRDVLGYGVPASLAAVTWVGFRNCDYAIVGARLGAQQAGFYFRAYTVAVEYQKKVSLVMGQVGFPVLSRTRSPEEMAVMRGQMVRLLTIVLFPLLVVLAIVAPVLVPWLFGSAWAPAVVPTQILAVGGAATLVIDAVGAALMAQGRPKALLGYGTVHFGVYALTVLVVSPLGLTAVAISAAAVHGLFLIAAYALMLRRVPERTLPCLWHDIAPATVSCVGLAVTAVPAAILASATHAPAIIQLASVVVMGAPAYLLTIRAIFPEAWRLLGAVVQRFLPVHRLPWVRRRFALARDTFAET